jgi:DNA-binding GntR family transcriptional regulator
VSRQPVRAALQLLEADGWAVPRGRRGLVVAPLSARDAEDLSLLRAEVESLALQLSLPHLTKAFLGAAEDLHDRLASETDGAERAHLNWKLHRTLYEPCNRPAVLDAVDRLHRSAERYMAYQFNVVDNRRKSQREHAALLQACRRGKVDEAKRLLRTHILAAGEQLASYLSLQEHAQALR